MPKYPSESFANPLTEEEFLSLRRPAYPLLTRPQEIDIPVPSHWRTNDPPGLRRYLRDELADNPYFYENWGEKTPLDFAIKNDKELLSNIGRPLDEVLKSKLPKQNSKFLSKSLKAGSRYALGTVAMNYFLPGSFEENVISSVVFDVARLGFKHKFGGGWKSWVAGATGSGVSKLLMAAIPKSNSNNFSGYDDYYNNIEGLTHRGIAHKQRRLLTEFGSGYISPARKNRFGILNENSDDEEERLVKKQFFEFVDLLDKYGEKTGTGHKRILVPKNVINKQELTEDLGFVPVSIAIPEAGQTKSESFRHPYNLFHFHHHGKTWSMHEDSHAASTMMTKKWRMERKERTKKDSDLSMFEPVKHFISGLPHLLTEGVPGAFYYLKGKLFNTESMADRLKEEIDIEYFEELNKNPLFQKRDDDFRLINELRFSGRDDDFNTVEGLRHGGLSEHVRKALTEFGSGWDPMRRIAKEIFGESADSFKQLTSLPEFKQALKSGIESGGKQLGEAGMQGYVKAHQGLLKYKGKEYPFEFAVKHATGNLGDFVTKDAYLAEIKAGSTLGHLNAPSLYGASDDIGIEGAFAMEKFNVSSSANVLSKQEVNQLTGFIEEAHQAGITHTDLHSGNVLKVLDDAGKEQIGVIDWGMANRFERSAGIGAHQAGTGAHHFAIKLLEEKAPGLSMHEYSQMSDLARAKTYGLEKTSRERRIANQSINIFYAGALKETKKENIDTIVDSVLSQSNSLELSPSVRDLSIISPVTQGTAKIGKLLEKTQDVAYLKTAADTISTDKTIMAQPQTVATKNIKKKPMPHVPQKTIAERRQTIKRVQNFNEVSTRAVGLGNRQSHKATRGHSRFSSLG